ncbi:hypothetical protein C8R43DRAFT_1129286 [Mycena crocata]|nr:hypothetical protein C8R43DRAFT_1129286 [Mycena crocata]
MPASESEAHSSDQDSPPVRIPARKRKFAARSSSEPETFHEVKAPRLDTPEPSRYVGGAAYYRAKSLSSASSSMDAFVDLEAEESDSQTKSSEGESRDARTSEGDSLDGFIVSDAEVSDGMYAHLPMPHSSTPFLTASFRKGGPGDDDTPQVLSEHSSSDSPEPAPFKPRGHSRALERLSIARAERRKAKSIFKDRPRVSRWVNRHQ